MKRTTAHLKALDKPKNRTEDLMRIRGMRHAVSATPFLVANHTVSGAEKRVVKKINRSHRARDSLVARGINCQQRGVYTRQSRVRGSRK